MERNSINMLSKVLPRRLLVSLVGVLVVGAFVGVSIAAASGLISNGGFESYTDTYGGSGSGIIAPWSIDSGDIDVVAGWQPSEGLVSIDLNGFYPGSISQSFATDPGEEYEVLFDLAGNPGTDVVTVEVSAAGQSATYDFDTAGHSVADMGWEEKSFAFTAMSSATTLSFSSLTTLPKCLSGLFAACGPALDNIRVTSTAPPLPDTKDQCKKGGWKEYGVFKNQGDCVSFVATGGKNRPAFE